jgi:hypothetical protein
MIRRVCGSEAAQVIFDRTRYCRLRANPGAGLRVGATTVADPFEIS